MSHRYPTPEAFRQALEQRLRNANQRGEDLVRQRQLVVFDRFLARIDTEFGASAVLKGGLVLEYRTARSLETHIAEKLHAYTLPRTRPNSRVKDLPDLALLGTVRELELATLRTALRETFAFRGTHPLPTSVPSPPSTWHAIYAAMAREDGLPWPTIEDLFAAVQSFLAPVLRGDAAERWAPTAWRWS